MLLAADTAPTVLPSLLPQVAAPDCAAPALDQLGLETTKLPFASTVSPPSPNRSSVVLPTRLLAAETVPIVATLWLTTVTAPAPVADPLFHIWLTTTKFPFGRILLLATPMPT